MVPSVFRLGQVALLATQLVHASGFDNAQVVGRDVELLDEYDYVIAGGGIAGLTVADRLSEDSSST